MYVALLVGGPYDGAEVETEQDGPDQLHVSDPYRALYRRAGRLGDCWCYQFRADEQDDQ